jgi:hypothetical protein
MRLSGKCMFVVSTEMEELYSDVVKSQCPIPGVFSPSEKSLEFDVEILRLRSE